MEWSSTIYVKNSIRWYLGKFVQIEDTRVWSTQNRIGIVRHGDSSEDIVAQSSEVEDDGEEKHRSETSIANIWRQKWENWKKRAVFERRQSVVSCMRVTIVQSRYQKPHHTLSHKVQTHEVEVCREKEMPVAKGSLKSSIDRRVHTSWKVLAPNRLVSIGILPNVNSFKLNLDVSSAQSAPSRTGRQVAIVKSVVELRITGHWAARFCNDFWEGHKSVGTNSTNTIHEGCIASSKHLRK